MVKRIGFACKWVKNTNNRIESVAELNNRVTTVSWLNRQTKLDAEQRLWDIMQHNLTASLQLVKKVGSLTDQLRMVRLSSDILPMYTEGVWSTFWKRPDVRNYCESNFSIIGEVARNLNVRISMHPGQFCCLSSDRTEVVENSRLEIEYHSDMIRWMGYGKSWQDFKCNIHVGGRVGPTAIRNILPKLSSTARNTLTIENDEISWGLDDTLKLADCLPLVIDLHHHFIKTGEYILPSDARITKVKDSWRGIRPVIHYSQCRPDVVNSSLSSLPDLSILVASGIKKQQLRGHSEYFTNSAVNSWAYGHWNWADIMCELKSKNLGSQLLYESWNI